MWTDEEKTVEIVYAELISPEEMAEDSARRAEAALRNIAQLKNKELARDYLMAFRTLCATLSIQLDNPGTNVAKDFIADMIKE